MIKYRFSILSRFSISALFVALLLSGQSTANAEIKIATVDVSRILNESKIAVSKKKELEQYQTKAQANLKDQQDELKILEQKIKEDNLGEDSPEATKLRSEARSFNRTVKETEEELKAKSVKINKELTDKAMALVKSYAENNSIDLVLERSAKNRSAVLFGSDENDITDSILEKFDKK